MSDSPPELNFSIIAPGILLGSSQSTERWPPVSPHVTNTSPLRKLDVQFFKWSFSSYIPHQVVGTMKREAISNFIHSDFPRSPSGFVSSAPPILFKGLSSNTAWFILGGTWKFKCTLHFIAYQTWIFDIHHLPHILTLSSNSQRSQLCHLILDHPGLRLGNLHHLLTLCRPHRKPLIPVSTARKAVSW